MKKNKIIEAYNYKIKLLEKYNKNYFDKNNPLVSDHEYDQLKKEILKLESNHNFLNSEKSPLNKVGFKPSKNFTKIVHKIPMLSLAKTLSEDDLLNFEKKNFKFSISK